MTHPEHLAPSGLLRGRLEHLDGRVEFHLWGELDISSADGFRERVAELSAATNGEVILDLADLRFLGSSGLRTLIQIHDELERESRRLVLRNPSRSCAGDSRLTETEACWRSSRRWCSGAARRCCISDEVWP